MEVQTPDNSELIYIIESEKDLTEFQAQHEDEVLQISMHAMLGIGAAKNTFTINVQLETNTATALIDSGSPSTFIIPEFAAQLLC